MPYNNSLIPWRLIPIDIPPDKHRRGKFMKKLYENGGNLQEPSSGSSQSTEGSPTPERILKKNIMPNGAENITVVVFNKGNNSTQPPKSSDKKEKTRKVRRVSNEVQSPEPNTASRPSHSLDNLPSSYQRSNLTERHDRTTSHERLSSHDRNSSHERSSHRKERRSWTEERSSRSESSKSRHSDPVNPPLRPWFRSHDMVEDYGRHRPPEELPQQYRSAYAANIRVSLDSNSPRKVYDDSYHGPTRHRRHSDEPKRTKTPYSRQHSHTPAQDRLVKLEKQFKEDRDRKALANYYDTEASGSDAETKRRKSPPDVRIEKLENGEPLELDEEALEGIYQVKAEEIGSRRNGMRTDDLMYSTLSEKSPSSSYERFSKYETKAEEVSSVVSPSSDSKCSNDSTKSKVEERSSKTSNKPSYQSNLYKRKHANEHCEESMADDKLKNVAKSLVNKRPRTTSPEMMDWAPIDTEVINSEIEEIRRNGLVTYSPETSDKSLSSALNPNNHSMENNIFIVVDTNVMCTDIVRNLSNTSLAGIDLVLYVPWQVLMELDALKSSKRDVARQAQRACSVLSDRSYQSSGRIRSQPPNLHHCSFDGFKPETPDDFILLAALQIKNDGNSVILLTNDKNLSAKAEASGIKNFTDVGISKVMNSKNRKSEVVALEKPPPETARHPEFHMAYRLAAAFKSLLTSCLNRLEELRGKLWVLYVPFLPPWSLIDAIKTLRSTWDVICSDSSNHYKQFQLFNSIQYFFKDTTYDNMSMEKLRTLFDECCTLATSLPVSFTELADSFISQAKEILEEHYHEGESANITSKLSEVDDLEELTPEEKKESVSNIIDQFDVFSQKLLSFCGYVYGLKGIEWPNEEPLPGENKFFSEEFIQKFTPFAALTLQTIISSLNRLNNVEIGLVDSTTEGVAAVHKCLVDFNGDLYKYSVRDVAAFANNPQVRSNMDRGIKELQKLADILDKIV